MSKSNLDIWVLLGGRNAVPPSLRVILLIIVIAVFTFFQVVAGPSDLVHVIGHTLIGFWVVDFLASEGDQGHGEKELR
jgi:hypothetical protein